MKLVLDVENTVTKRNDRLHLDPFETNNSLVMIGMKSELGEQPIKRTATKKFNRKGISVL